MIAKFKDGTPCTIRALLAFAEKCSQNFIDLTEDWDITIRSIDRKANGRIKHICFSIIKPLIINGEKSDLYKIAIRFDGNEKSANDFLDDEVFAKGIRVDEDKMTMPFIIPPLDECIQLWSADHSDQEKAIEAAYKEAPTKSLDELISEGIPPLKKKHEPKTLYVSSACEGMYMDTD